MADDIDIANERIEMDRAALLKQRKPEPSISETGCCLHCDEPVPPGRRWCDANCRNSWEKEQ